MGCCFATHCTAVNIAEESCISDQYDFDNLEISFTGEIHENLVHFHSKNVENGEKSHVSDNFIESVVNIVIIDADDFDDDHENPDQYRLEQICYNIQPLTNLHKIKEELAKSLSLVNVKTSTFNDFNLDCMSSSNEVKDPVLGARESKNSIRITLTKSISLYYQASLLLQYVSESTANAAAKKSLKRQVEHLNNICLVVGNALKVNGWIVPDLEPTRMKFDLFKARLPQLVNEYLESAPQFQYQGDFYQGSGSELLRQYQQLVINYEIVKEVEYAIFRLHDVFGTIKAKVLGEGSFSFSGADEERLTV